MDTRRAIKELKDCISRVRYIDNEQIGFLEIGAAKLAIAAIEKQQPMSPYPDGDISIFACPNCGSGEYLHNPDENRNMFCGQCGQKIDWKE